MADATSALSLALVGDLILGEPDPDFYFDAVREVLRSKDLVVGHVEVPHTRRGREQAFDIPAEPYDPERLHALGRAGFHVATLAGNHVYDFGADGIVDTQAGLAAAGLLHCGAGLDLQQATEPVRREQGRVRVGILSYNCAGPPESWAGESKPGCAYVRVLRADGSECRGPSPAELLDTRPDPDSVDAMQRAIERLAAEVTTVIVSLHKGIVHSPARLAGYERPVARAAAEAGASLIVSHHAHILRGVEVVGDCPVFHGLGNFVTVTRALSADNPHPARRAWALKRRELFGFTPDPRYPNYPFHPEARHAMIADCRVGADGRVKPGFLACSIRPTGQPEIHGRDARGQVVFDYVADISRRAGLEAELAWDGDRVVFG